MDQKRSNGFDYLIIAYIIIPTLLIALFLALLYVFCSKRFKLNWYEKVLLEENCAQKRGDVDVLAEAAIERKSNRTYKKRIRFQTPKQDNWAAIVEVLKSWKQKFSARIKTSAGHVSDENDRKTEWIYCSKKSLGSSTSSPIIEGSDEKFWVPPAVLDRKRAQSLVPTVTHNDSEEEASSGNITPASLGSGITCSFPSAPLINADGLPPALPPCNRQRRASMQDAIDFRKIDSKLYDRRLLQRQESVASVEEEHLGTLNFSLEYNHETHLLTVHLIEAENLVPRTFSGTADPYCKVCLLAHRRAELQSKVHRKTTYPVFDEEFIFEVPPSEFKTSTLELLLFDYDEFSRHEGIGQVKVQLHDTDLEQKQIYWKPICQMEQPKQVESEQGDLIFSLGYLSSAERLTVVLMKARNLRHLEDGRITIDPYVKVALSCDGKKAKKKKTSTKHNVVSPVWNEALTFSVPRDNLQSVCLDFTVLHDNKMGNDELLGKLRISRDSHGDERLHWDEMVNCRSTVARWHALKA